MKLDKILLVAGIILVAYAIFSKFYGQPCIAMKIFKSSSFILLGNTALLLGLYFKK